MLLMRGTVLGVTESAREWTNPDTREVKRWNERTIHLLDGVHTQMVTIARDFDPTTEPVQGDEVVLEVWAKGSGKRVYFTTPRVMESKSPSAKAS